VNITYNVPDAVGKEIKQLPDAKAIEVLHLASKQFQELTDSQAKKMAVELLRNHTPPRARMTAVETVRKMRDERDTRKP
jgi:hypothetical protein